MKGYCECFQAGVLCSELCKCTGCKNYEDSPELQNVRTNQVEAGQSNSISNGNGITVEDGASLPIPKRSRVEPMVPNNSHRPAELRKQLVSSSVRGTPSLLMSPLFERERSSSPRVATECDVVKLLERQCNQLAKIAEDELQVAAERKGRKNERSRETQIDNHRQERTAFGGLDEGCDVQLMVERAVMEETAAILNLYCHQVKFRAEKRATNET